MDWKNMFMVQVVTESLPISSSTHLLFISSCFPSWVTNLPFSSYEHLEFIMHIPTVLVFSLYFFRRWFTLLFGVPCTWATLISPVTYEWRKLLPVIKFFWVAESLTVGCWLFKKIAGSSLVIDSASQIELSITGLLVTAWLLYKSDSFDHTQAEDKWSLRSAWFLGCAQSVALLTPGISRMGITVVTALWLSYRRADALALSTLLCMPLLVASSVKALFELTGSDIYHLMQPSFLLLLAGALVLSSLALALVEYLVRTRRLYLVSIYLVGLVVAYRLYMGW